jgi:hypothetical protein
MPAPGPVRDGDGDRRAVVARRSMNAHFRPHLGHSRCSKPATQSRKSGHPGARHFYGPGRSNQPERRHGCGYLNTAHGMRHRSCFLRYLGNTLRSSADGTRASIQVALLNAHRLRGQRRKPCLRCHGGSRERPSSGRFLRHASAHRRAYRSRTAVEGLDATANLPKVDRPRRSVL